MLSLVWIGFIVLVLGLLALDLGVFHRQEHVVSIKEALAWSALWITLARRPDSAGAVRLR